MMKSRVVALPVLEAGRLLDAAEAIAAKVDDITKADGLDATQAAALFAMLSGRFRAMARADVESLRSIPLERFTWSMTGWLDAD